MSAVVGHGTHGELFASVNALFRLSKTTDGHGTHTHRESLGAVGIVLLWVIRLNIKPRVFSLGDFFFLFLDCFLLDDGPADRERESPNSLEQIGNVQKK